MVTIAVPKERAPGERRVALVPEVVARLVKQGAKVRVERGAGEGAYHPDTAYQEAGAEVVERGELLQGANLLFTVQPPPEDLIGALEPGAIVVGFVQAHKNLDLVKALAAKKATV
ncbi:MAG: NAD(P)(+) transhydrogenase (Re/Si-specific) subunit alpha, partial [Thermus sp.]